jgi:hypothetical protein
MTAEGCQAVTGLPASQARSEPRRALRNAENRAMGSDWLEYAQEERR